MNDLCNRAGMDTISTGSAVAFAMDCYEAGVLTAQDVDGLDLRFGNAEAAETLVGRIVRREGVGDLLADGVREAARRIGPAAEPFAVHCGGIEAPMHDPRFDPGFLPLYAWDPSPGRHTTASFQYADLQHLEAFFGRARKVPPMSMQGAKFRPEGSGEALAVNAFFRMLLDAAGGCLFGTQIGGGMPLCAWMDAVTGNERSPDDRLQDGERIYQLRHAFNVREGLHARRDQIPHPRVYGDPPVPTGPHRGRTLDVEGFARSWYEALHWDPATDLPPRERLLALGLPQVANTLLPEA
jgi:aldehyde:ferredoxin oxidoreductase